MSGILSAGAFKGAMVLAVALASWFDIGRDEWTIRKAKMSEAISGGPQSLRIIYHIPLATNSALCRTVNWAVRHAAAPHASKGGIE
jgi:hypothetical protein